MEQTRCLQRFITQASPRFEAFARHSSGFREYQPRLGKATVGTQVDWLHDALCDNQRPASLKGDGKCFDDDLLSRISSLVEGGLGTPPLRGLATPVGVVNDGGFGHDWIVNAFAARRVLFASDVEAVGR